jgi:hypothetical protein
MTDDLQQLDGRVRALEVSAKRWRWLATTLCAVVVALVATAFYPARSTQTIDAQRITLRSEGTTVGSFTFPPSRMEMSLDSEGGLRLQYFSQRPELRLVDAAGREVVRLGGATFRLVK